MSTEQTSFSTAKAAFRGKMLIATFPDAAPPVVWRWLAGDASAGFGLRQADGKVDLVRYDSGATPVLIASFHSVAAGEQALNKISDALLSYHAPWKQITKWVVSIASLVLVLFGMLYVYVQVEKGLTQSRIAQLQAAQAKAAAKVPATGQLPQKQLEAIQRQQQEQANKPPTPPAGSAVDVDSYYH